MKRTERISEPERGQESKGVRRVREDKGDEVPSLFLHQIVDFAPAPTQLVLYLGRTFPHPTPSIALSH